VASEARTDTAHGGMPSAEPLAPSPDAGPEPEATTPTPTPTPAPGSRARPDLRRLLAHYVPIAAWLPTYPREWLRPDVLSALTSWGVMVPVALAYASLAGMPASVGIVTAMVALTAYAVLGTSRHLKVTASSTMAVMSLAVVTPLAAGDPARFIALTATLAFIVGLLLLGAGLLRLGFLSEFLAKPVITGFILGVSITIVVGQLPKLLGVPATGGSVLDQVVGLVQHLPETDPWDLAIGGGALVLILVLRHIDRRIPAPLVALVISIPLVTLLGLADKGVAVVGPVPTGIPMPSVPSFPMGDLFFLLTGAAGIGFLALGESIGSARAFATRNGYRIDPDQELVALGAANLAAGMFGGFAVDASLSQTATGEVAGNRSQLSSLVTAALLLATALFLAPLFQNLPQAVLGAIVIAAVVSLVDIPEFRRYVDQRRTDFALSLVALIGVIATTVLIGLVIAALVSIVLLLYRASQPAVTTLGRIPGSRDSFGDVTRNPGALPVPTVLTLRLDTPLYYFNATEVETRILLMVEAADPRPRTVVLDIGATNDLDVTTADMLLELLRALAGLGVSLSLAQAKGRVRDRMRHNGLMDAIDEDHVFLTVPIAVDAATREPPSPGFAAGPAA